MSTASSSSTPQPAHKLTQPPWLRTLYEVLHEVRALKICSHNYNDEIIFVQLSVSKYVQMSRKPCKELKKIGILRKKWAKFQIKVQKSSKDHFMREVWGPIWESRRSVLYLGDSRIIWESWYICIKRWGQRISTGYYECGLQLLSLENRRKIEPKKSLAVLFPAYLL